MKKKPAQKVSRRDVIELQKDRFKIDDLVRSKSEILGSMLGVKIKNGVPTGDLSMTFFVREKLPYKELPKRAHIPKNVTIDTRTWPTDVIVWPKMINHGSLRGSAITFDGNVQGTLSCFATSNGQLYGMSCAHCLMGADGNPATPTGVQLWSSTQRMFIDVGQSVYAVFSSGIPSSGTSGFIDCGIFDIENSQVHEWASRATPISLVNDIRTLLNQKVFGRSALLVGNDSLRTATVIGIDQQVLDHHADIILMVEPPGLFHGDSGMLWVTTEGRGVGIHTRGEIKPNTEGSVLVAAMSAVRAAKSLNTTLLVG